MIKGILCFISSAALVFFACTPDRDDDFQLPAAPDKPEFSVSFVEGDSNRGVITDLSSGQFQRLWDLPGGTPKISAKGIDTIFYTDEGQYTITLYISGMDGGGSAYSSKSITILKDAPMECTPKMAILTGDCGPTGKCWTFTTAGGAVKVGPGYNDFSWYTSPVNGLQAAQYDDVYCVTFDDLTFEIQNNGQSVNPWNGYQPANYDPGITEFIFLEGTGTDGRDQIIMPDNQIMGVWDADNVMDVISLTEDQLVVRARLCGQNGVPAAEGWFELTFVPR
jgi:hypothetical protein